MRLQISFKPYSAYSQAMASAREQRRKNKSFASTLRLMLSDLQYTKEKKILLMTQSRIDFKLAANNDNLLKQIIEAENSHDIERLLALVTDDVVIEDVPFVPFGMVMKGKDGVRQG